MTLTALRDDAGHLRGFSNITRDLTERQLADEALRKSEERFQIVARATNDALWDWDIINNTLWWSANVLTLCGHCPDETTTHESWSKRLYPEDHGPVLARLRDALKASRRSL